MSRLSARLRRQGRASRCYVVVFANGVRLSAPRPTILKPCLRLLPGRVLRQMIAYYYTWEPGG